MKHIFVPLHIPLHIHSFTYSTLKISSTLHRKVLSQEVVIGTVMEHFLLWGWDVTSDSGKRALRRFAGADLRIFSAIHKYPFIAILSKSKRKVEPLTVHEGEFCF